MISSTGRDLLAQYPVDTKYRAILLHIESEVKAVKRASRLARSTKIGLLSVISQAHSMAKENAFELKSLDKVDSCRYL